MTGVLVLNSDFTPINSNYIVSEHRAINLLIGNRATLVESSGRSIRSTSTVFEIPSVIVLKRYIKAPRRNMKWSKSGIFKRDNFICQYCGVKTDGSKKMLAPTIDHVIPRIKGGQNTWTNTVCACKKCNSKKGARDLGEVGYKLLSEPKTPRGLVFVVSRNGGEIREEWRKYLEIG